MEKLTRMRELLSNSLPDGSEWNQVLEYVSDQVIHRRDKTLNKSESQHQISSRTRTLEKAEHHQDSHRQLSHKDQPLVNRLSIPLSTQKDIFKRDQCCQYVDKNSGRKCQSRWKLHIDHIQPIWAGGSNELVNLRLLCANHNRELYKWQTYMRTL